MFHVEHLKRKFMYTNTIGWKQNNLGNLRGEGIKWQGKTGFQNGFSVFESKEYGVRAIYLDLINKIKTGTNTIEKIISKYAPSSENDTLNYISFVSKNTGIPKNQPLNGSKEEIRNIVRSIIKHEIGFSAPQDLLVKAENLLPQDLLVKAENLLPQDLLVKAENLLTSKKKA